MVSATTARTRHAVSGFSLLELVLVIALIAILIAVAASRLLPYVSKAESVAVMRLEGQLRNVLLMEAAILIARGQSASLVDLDHANPMSFLLEPPPTYLGELRDPTRALLPRRSWHFDTSRRRLVYRAGRGFENADADAVIREYAIRIRFADKDGNARFTPGADEFHGVRLEHVDTSQIGV